MYRLMLTSALCLLPTSAWAVTLTIPSVDLVISSADAVAQVQILKAEVQNFEHDGERERCGVLYHAEVKEEVRGSPGRLISFVSDSALATGAEYLLFFFTEQNVIPSDSAEAARLDPSWRAEYQQCREKTGAHRIGGYPFEFYNAFVESDGQLAWLLKRYGLPVLPDSIKTMKLRCEADLPNGCDRIGEPVLIHWPSFRSYLKEYDRAKTVNGNVVE